MAIRKVFAHHYVFFISGEYNDDKCQSILEKKNEACKIWCGLIMSLNRSILQEIVSCRFHVSTNQIISVVLFSIRSPAELSELSVWRIKHLGPVRTSATSDYRRSSRSISFDFETAYRIASFIYLIYIVIVKLPYGQ